MHATLDTIMICAFKSCDFLYRSRMAGIEILKVALGAVLQ